ncbi:MAG: hypothetical protein RIG68_27465 [Imperialibacter sp.]|uniref:hypothetical protein n=1 Tax=Imperialibacter sp. TaxID=2038411 RepID=UPI0032EB6A81
MAGSKVRKFNSTYAEMIRKLNFQFAAKAMITLPALVLVRHLLIITGAIPYEATWGGRLSSHEDMIQFESVSILINLFIVAIVSIKAGYLRVKVPAIVITAILWLLVLVFAINTVGNLVSASFWEMIIFTPFTIVSAILCLRMALEKVDEAQT